MKFFLLFFLLIFYAMGFSQTDSLKKEINKINKVTKPIVKDTLNFIVDSTDTIQIKHKTDSLLSVKKDSIGKINKDTTVYNFLLEFPLVNSNKPEYMVTSFKESNAKDFLFYLLIGLVFLLALTQVMFPRYFRNVFDIFFQTNFRQRQTKEQLTQENIASLLLNILFVISAATFVTLISDRFIHSHISFWKIFLSALIVLTGIYLCKMLFTQFMGWVFNKKEIAESYSFIVFIINKIIGVTLIPFCFLLAYSTSELKHLSYTISVMLICFLFLFRFFNTYKNLSGRLKINAFHFFLYFCSVEILPLLIIYKSLNDYVSNGI